MVLLYVMPCSLVDRYVHDRGMSKAGGIVGEGERGRSIF